jgi:hypothetical protein
MVARALRRRRWLWAAARVRSGLWAAATSMAAVLGSRGGGSRTVAAVALGGGARLARWGEQDGRSR